MKKTIIALTLAATLLFPLAAQAQTVTVTSGVNVRSGASVTSPVLGKLKKGDTFEYLGGNQYWNHIVYNGMPAFVSTKYTKVTGDVITEPIAPEAETIISFGKQFLGAPYSFSNTVTSGDTFIRGDCSGFTRFIYGKFGVKLPAGSKYQSKVGQAIDKSELQAGDLIFSDTNRDGVVNHVLVYIGNDQVLHTYKVGIGVTISKFSGSTWDKTFVNARRVL